MINYDAIDATVLCYALETLALLKEWGVTHAEIHAAFTVAHDADERFRTVQTVTFGRVVADPNAIKATVLALLGEV